MDLRVTVDIPKTPLFSGAGAAPIIHEEMMAATEYGVAVVESAIAPLAPVDRGMFRAGIQTKVYGEPAIVTGTVFNPLTYALPVEDGSKPHWPPQAPLAAWAQRKLGLSADEAKSVGFLIARKISRVGTRAHRPFARGFAAAKEQVVARYEQMVASIVSRLGSGR